MSRVFVAEQLTAAVAQKFAGAIAASERCLAIDAWDSALASSVIGDPRWHPGTMAVWDGAVQRLKDWARQLVREEMDDGPWLERGMVASGLEARLRRAAAAMCLHQEYLDAAGGSSACDVSLVADDPYLRDAFHHAAWLDQRPRSVEVARLPGSPPLRTVLRERSAEQLWLRAPFWRRGARAAAPRRAPGAGKTALALTVSRRSIKQLQPVLLGLIRRGWRVVVVHYTRDLPSDDYMSIEPMGEIVPFHQASAGWRLSSARQPRWKLDRGLAGGSPVSPRWLRVALAASWVSGAVQVARHRRMLEVWRPDVVFGYGTDLPSLALQVGADELAIPTVYVPHGFEVANRSFYAFSTTATVVYGPACAEINRVGPEGPRAGLVATGHPPHDAIVGQHQRAGGRRLDLPGLTPPPARPHLVLGFATWGFDLLSHMLQDRFLRMLSAALPPDAFLVCKLHPGFEERRFCEAILKEVLPPDAFRLVGEREFTTTQLLAGCRVAVSHERSMVLSDAVLAGIPAIAVRHAETPFGVADRNHPGKDYSKSCWIVGDTAELRRAIDTLNHDEVARARLLANRQEYLDRFLMADGQATQRITDLVEHLAAGGRADSFAVR